MAYAVALLVHSYLRWLLLALGLLSLARSLHGWARRRPYTLGDQRWAAAFVGVADLQLTVGLLLFLWLSPFSTAFFAGGLRAALDQPVLRFFGLLHPLLMIAGIVLLHGARVRARRAVDDVDRHRILALGQLGWLLLVALAMPWPSLAVGRPLLRGLG